MYERFDLLKSAGLVHHYITNMVDKQYDNLPYWLLLPNKKPAEAAHCRVDDAELVGSWYEGLVSAMHILGTTDDPSPLKAGEGEAMILGQWVVQEEYEDIMRKFSLLDEFGQKTVAGVLRTEFARCQEQGTLKSGKSVSVSVKVREVVDPINEDLPD